MKLEIESVNVKNFLSFGNREQEIPFNTGVNIVLGKDLSTGRSNGAGKSTFLETIPFALYGTTHKDIRKAQLINWKNKKGLEVVLSFKKGNIQYRVVRAIKPDNFEIWENDVLLEKPAHVRDYQKTLEDIIGLNFNTFSSLIHSNINSSNKILSMSKPDKRKFIEDVFGLHLYSHLNGKANVKIGEQNVKISDVERTIQYNEATIESINEQIEELQGKIRRLGSSELELRDARIMLKEIEDKHPNIDKKIKDLSLVIEDLKTKDSENQKLSTAVETRISGENEKARALRVKFLKLDEVEKFRKQLENLELNRGKLETILEEIQIAKDDIESGEVEYEKISDQLNETQIEGARYETQYDNLNLRIKNLSEHKKCPTCDQTLKHGKKDIFKKFTDELALIDVQKVSKRKLIDDMSKSKDTLGAVLAQRKRDLQKMEEDRDAIYSIKQKINVDYDRSDLEKEQQLVLNDIRTYESELEKLEAENKKIKNKISTNQSELEELKTKMAVIESKKRAIEALEIQVSMEEKQKKEFQSLIATHKIKIQDLNSDTISLNKKIRTYRTVIDYLEVIKELCKDENIKQYAISSIMPFLNKQANHYLSEVGYGFYAILDKWLDADIKGPGVTNGSYGSLSGGEARGIDLAIQFALLDIARIQAGIWPDILIMDEILDSSVDGKGIAKLMDIIKVKQTQEDNKVFIISHRDEIGDTIEADYTYFVTKDRGFSGVKIS